MTMMPAETETVEQRDQRREREAVRETRSAAMRAAIGWAPFGPVICIATLWFLRKGLVSANELLSDKSEFVWEPFMPVTLLAGACACYAAFLTWRVTQSSGAVGAPVILVGAGCVLLTTAICAIASFAIFADGVPMLVWLSLAVMAALGVGVVWVVSYISG